MKNGHSTLINTGSLYYLEICVASIKRWKFHCYISPLEANSNFMKTIHRYPFPQPMGSLVCGLTAHWDKRSHVLQMYSGLRNTLNMQTPVRIIKLRQQQPTQA